MISSISSSTSSYTARADVGGDYSGSLFHVIIMCVSLVISMSFDQKRNHYGKLNILVKLLMNGEEWTTRLLEEIYNSS